MKQQPSNTQADRTEKCILPALNIMTQLTIFASSRLTKRSREDIAKIDAAFMSRENRLGVGFHPIIEEEEEQEETPKIPNSKRSSRNCRRQSTNRRLQQIQHGRKGGTLY